MRIREIKTNYYKIPLPRVLSDATHGIIPYFELITVKVFSDSGEEGMGYTYTVGRGGGAIHKLIENDLAPLIINLDPRCTEKIWRKMWNGIHWVGRSGMALFGISAIDIALWDLKARNADEPLWRFLGGNNPEVNVYPGGVDLNFTIKELCEQTIKNLELGYSAIKIKVGREKLSEDVERVKTVRKLIGPNIRLMIDANMGWTVDEAIRASQVLSAYNIYWLEEPTIPEDIGGFKQIFIKGGIPIAAGENLHSLYEFKQTIFSNNVLFPEVDVSNVGGITTWMKVAHLAEANNLKVTTHGVHDLHIHLLGAIPNASYLEVHSFGLEQFIEHPMEIKDGVTMAPNLPGHGINLNWEKLKKYQKNQE